MTTHTPHMLLLVVVLALLASACAGAVGDDGLPISSPGSADIPSSEPGGDPIPVEPDGGIGDGAGPPPAGSQDADQPIPVEPDGGIGDGAGPPAPLSSPPDFGVSSETDSTSLSPYTSCWTDPNTDTGVCSDGFPRGGSDPLTADAQIVITFEPGTLTAELGAADPEQDTTQERIALPVTEDNPGIWLVDVSSAAPGQAGLWLSWQGEQGDAFAFLTLDVV